MLKPIILSVLSLSLMACSAPKPPKIEGDNEEVNLAKPKPPSDEVLLLTQINQQLAMNNAVMMEMNKPKAIKPSQSFVIHYPFDQTRATIAQISHSLVAAKSACKVELRARTDGTIPTTRDKDVARERAINLRNQFVQYGISPQVVYINYAASTDYVDSNWTELGRANNRRVEIDIYEDCSGVKQ